MVDALLKKYQTHTASPILRSERDAEQGTKISGQKVSVTPTTPLTGGVVTVIFLARTEERVLSSICRLTIGFNAFQIFKASSVADMA
jgi:hypothetical protein